MKVTAFGEKYRVDPQTIHRGRRNGTINSSAFYIPDKEKVLHVREEFFIRRREFKKRVQMQNQDMYFYLEEFFSISDISFGIAKIYDVNANSMREYLEKDLFISPMKESIATYRIGEREYNFMRYGRRVLRYLKMKYGQSIDIEKLLDRRAGI